MIDKREFNQNRLLRAFPNFLDENKLT